jgi:hypothetical protein
MERIEPLMEKFPNDAIASGEAAVKNVAVKEIFDESPSDTARCEESDGAPSVCCRKCDSQYEYCVQSVEDGQWVEAATSESGLTPLVGRERDFGGRSHW